MDSVELEQELNNYATIEISDCIEQYSEVLQNKLKKAERDIIVQKFNTLAKYYNKRVKFECYQILK